MEFELITDQDTWFSQSRALRAAKEERDAIVGDAVHLWDGMACRAAVVTDDPELDSLWVSFLMPGETSWRPVRDVRHDEAKGEMTWHWPCGGQ